ncbi:hypothetical protein GCM10023188_39280 [Pontibacter saemangeumensis]|uniref:Uncharacterized protein n=1 Tax=Pontibacter saemangeumensis TaxID=1084525 RepID=A0ABP8LZE8_9BACT
MKKHALITLLAAIVTSSTSVAQELPKPTPRQLEWQKANQYNIIGYKRLLRFPLIKTFKVRITVLEAKQSVQLAEVGLYKVSAKA